MAKYLEPRPDELELETDYYAGLDIGQQQDYTALCIIKRHRQIVKAGPRIEEKVSNLTGKTITLYDHRPKQQPPVYKARYVLDFLERYDLGTPYPVINDSVCKLYSKLPLRGTRLAVDYTGPGMPAVDWLRRTMKDSSSYAVLWPILITGGS